MSSAAVLLMNIGVIALVDGLLIGACGFAWWKGRPAERIGALLFFAAAVASLLLATFSGKAFPIVPELFFDALVAVGFLFLAIRYNSLWLGAAMVLKGVQLALHAYHLTDEADLHIGGWNVYGIALDVVSVLISTTILSGTVASIRERRRGRHGSDLGLTSQLAH